MSPFTRSSVGHGIEHEPRTGGAWRQASPLEIHEVVLATMFLEAVFELLCLTVFIRVPILELDDHLSCPCPMQERCMFPTERP